MLVAFSFFANDYTFLPSPVGLTELCSVKSQSDFHIEVCAKIVLNPGKPSAYLYMSLLLVLCIAVAVGVYLMSSSGKND